MITLVSAASTLIKASVFPVSVESYSTLTTYIINYLPQNIAQIRSVEIPDLELGLGSGEVFRHTHAKIRIRNLTSDFSRKTVRTRCQMIN